ncbi:hypothetical protein [Paenibacillus segetis]|uniref:Uncharacterized protein n=1 Tax=Paenibacillus segetis TaxID=1325360 RepID=A0ABQ1YTF3_9BACL|nr:hypothetical protein [Paenibacillus segetis]GGH38172.1 hypothetical protein GCM10008013_46080 [Paenibacillus segetis]
MENSDKNKYAGLYLISSALSAIYYLNTRFELGIPDFVQGVIMGAAMVGMVTFVWKMGKLMGKKAA